MDVDVEHGVARHYTVDGLLESILEALRRLGVDPDGATADDLKPVDEFHIGGIAATRELLAQVDITARSRVLDIGSGLGGTARFLAATTGASVTGLDLTPDYVATASALSRLVGLADKTRFEVGSALDLPFPDAGFDCATMLHVGMNIPDKARLMSEVARVLKPGGVFAVYDVMKTGPEPIAFPVPWADEPKHSFVESLEAYRAAAARAGFTERASRDRAETALAFFADQRARMEAEGAPALGVHLLLGETRAQKMKTMVENIGAGRIAPTELILETP